MPVNDSERAAENGGNDAVDVVENGPPQNEVMEKLKKKKKL